MEEKLWWEKVTFYEKQQSYIGCVLWLVWHVQDCDVWLEKCQEMCIGMVIHESTVLLLSPCLVTFLGSHPYMFIHC